jgi:hypothetical protein
LAQVAAYCEQRSTGDYRIAHSVLGASITILERRPPWNPAYGSERSSLKVAPLRYDDAARRTAARSRCTATGRSAGSGSARAPLRALRCGVDLTRRDRRLSGG